MIWFEHWWGIIFDHEFLRLQKSLLDRTRHTPVKASKELCHKNFFFYTFIKTPKLILIIDNCYWNRKIYRCYGNFICQVYFWTLLCYQRQPYNRKNITTITDYFFDSNIWWVKKYFYYFIEAKEPWKKLQVTLIKRMSFLLRLIIFIWTSKNWEFGKKGLIFFFLVPFIFYFGGFWIANAREIQANE